MRENKNIRDTLINARRNKCLSQEELAKMVGIRQTSYSRYELGQNYPRPIVARKLAEILEIPWQKFYE